MPNVDRPPAEGRGPERPGSERAHRAADPWSDDDAPPPRGVGAGCLVALIVSAIGIVVAAILVARAIGAALSGVTL